MSKNRNISLISKTFLLIAGSVYILNYLLKGFLAELFYFDPTLITNGNFEYWRLFSYPFATGTMEGVLLFSLTFYIVAPKLENILQKRSFYPILLFLLVSFQSFIFSVIYMYFDLQIQISGMEGVSIFILSLYILLKPNDKVGILNFPIMSTTMLSILIFLIWAGLKYYNITVNYEPITESAIAVSGFGIISSFIVFSVIKIFESIKIRQLKEKKDDVKQSKEKQEEKFSYAMTSRSNVKKYYQEKEMLEDVDELILSDDPQENEQILNDILDKINIHGKDSITTTEEKFLREYSKLLD